MYWSRQGGSIVVQIAVLLHLDVIESFYPRGYLSSGAWTIAIFPLPPIHKTPRTALSSELGLLRRGMSCIVRWEVSHPYFYINFPTPAGLYQRRQEMWHLPGASLLLTIANWFGVTILHILQFRKGSLEASSSLVGLSISLEGHSSTVASWSFPQMI